MKTWPNHRALLTVSLPAVSLLLLIGVATTALAEAEKSTGNVNVFLGTKSLEEEDWGPVEDQGEAGIEFDFRDTNWPINVALGFRRSEADETFVDPFFGPVDATGRTTELSFGVRKIWDQSGIVSPYLGGGLTLVEAEFEATVSGVSGSDSDSSVGLWFGGGVYFTLADHFNIGLDLRFSAADATLFGVDGGAGGRHLGLLVGYHF